MFCLPITDNFCVTVSFDTLLLAKNTKDNSFTNIKLHFYTNKVIPKARCVVFTFKRIRKLNKWRTEEGVADLNLQQMNSI